VRWRGGHGWGSGGSDGAGTVVAGMVRDTGVTDVGGRGPPLPGGIEVGDVAGGRLGGGVVEADATERPEGDVGGRAAPRGADDGDGWRWPSGPMLPLVPASDVGVVVDGHGGSCWVEGVGTGWTPRSV